ncbi:MAG: hypothetical protein KTR31_08770 [Myxococcales bacterium]|nr:hypothetical protein [Myxococcales bacterium]
MGPIRGWTLCAVTMGCAGSADPEPGSSQHPFSVDDVVISDPDVSLKDPEFDAMTSRVTWQAPDGSAVWVGTLDPATGFFLGAHVPAGAAAPAVVVDRAVAPFDTVFNGPEWMRTDRGSEIVYTGAWGNVFEVTRAVEVRPQVWQPEVVLEGRGAIGSLEVGDAEPAVIYLDDDDQTAWTAADGTAGAVFLPSKIQHNPWFVPGTDWLVFTARSPRWQIVRHSRSSGSFEVLTDCEDGCVEGTLFWSEELGDWLLGTVRLERIDGEGMPVAYTVMQQQGSGLFETLLDVQLPERDGLSMVLSPEVFHVAGRAYVSMQLSRHAGFGVNPSEIWIAGLEPSNPLVRRVSTDDEMVRKDPEHLVTSETAWIYYSEDVQDHRILHRCATGL